MLLGKTPFHKYISNSEYFKHINIGIEVLKGRRYCKEVILQQYRGIRTPLTIKSKIGLSKGVRALLTIKSKMGFSKGIRAPLTIKNKMGLSKNMAQAVIKEAGVTVFRYGICKEIDLGASDVFLKKINPILKY